MARDHGRTLSLEDYQKCCKTFQDQSKSMLDNNYTDSVMQLQHYLDNRKRSHWASVANKILALVDSIIEDHQTKLTGTRSCNESYC